MHVLEVALLLVQNQLAIDQKQASASAELRDNEWFGSSQL